MTKKENSMELKDYVWNAREAPHVYPVSERLNRPGATEKLQKWTITVHTPSCRHAPKDTSDPLVPKRGLHPYVGEDGYISLAQHGFTVGTRYTRTVWRGCRSCGTSLIPDDTWREMAKRHIEAERAAKHADYQRREEEWQVEQFRRASVAAQDEAEQEWLERHKAERRTVRAAALRRWSRENPDGAAALGLTHVVGDAESQVVTY